MKKGAKQVKLAVIFDHKRRRFYFVLWCRRDWCARHKSRRFSAREVRFNTQLKGRNTVTFAQSYHKLNTFFTQKLLRTVDAKPIMMEDFFQAKQQSHVIGAIKSPPTRPFDGFDLGKARFPETQDMGCCVKLLCCFRNCAKCIRGFVYSHS